jgi:hypothetical protein
MTLYQLDTENADRNIKAALIECAVLRQGIRDIIGKAIAALNDIQGRIR